MQPAGFVPPGLFLPDAENTSEAACHFIINNNLLYSAAAGFLFLEISTEITMRTATMEKPTMSDVRPG